MNNVVPINSKEFLSAYRYAQDGEWSPEATFLFVGGILSAVLPQTIISVYGGFTPLIAFFGVALGGAIWGLAMYRRAPDESAFRIDTGTMPQTPVGTFTASKKAA